MRTIRKGLFETNSSSIHSLNISNDDINQIEISKKINFEILETIDEDFIDVYPEYSIYSSIRRKASFLYCGILMHDKFYNTNYLNILKKILNKYDIDYTFDDPTNFICNYCKTESFREKDGCNIFLEDIETIFNHYGNKQTDDDDCDEDDDYDKDGDYDDYEDEDEDGDYDDYEDEDDDEEEEENIINENDEEKIKIIGKKIINFLFNEDSYVYLGEDQ